MNRFIADNRTLLMGYAILMVIIYHYGSWVYNVFGNFNIGFVGVDIFMFLSGWGLVYSYQNSKDINEFYIKRAKRILPVFYMMGGVIIFYRILSPSLTETPMSVFLELTTLSYWLQLQPTDWYLNCLIGFYILFPLLRRYISWYLLLFVTISVIIFDVYFKVRWDLASGIDRLPIFVLGIMCSAKNISQKQLVGLCVLSIASFMPLFMMVSERLALSCMVFVCLCILSISKILPDLKIVKWLGKNSLQIYAANSITFMFMSVANHGILIESIAFVLLQCLFTLMLIYFDKKIRAAVG